MNKLSTDLKYHCSNFLELEQYNHLELFFKIKPSYKLYFKNNKQLNINIDEVCENKKLININLVKFLHYEVKAKCTENAMDWASKNGHLEVVKFLHYEVKVKCTEVAITWASMNGHLAVVQFLKSIK